jgi:hypothetical protein
MDKTDHQVRKTPLGHQVNVHTTQTTEMAALNSQIVNESKHDRTSSTLLATQFLLFNRLVFVVTVVTKSGFLLSVDVHVQYVFSVNVLVISHTPTHVQEEERLQVFLTAFLDLLYQVNALLVLLLAIRPVQRVHFIKHKHYSTSILEYTILGSSNIVFIDKLQQKFAIQFHCKHSIRTKDYVKLTHV